MLHHLPIHYKKKKKEKGKSFIYSYLLQRTKKENYSFIHSFILILARKTVQKKKRVQKYIGKIENYFN